MTSLFLDTCCIWFIEYLPKARPVDSIIGSIERKNKNKTTFNAKLTRAHFPKQYTTSQIDDNDGQTGVMELKRASSLKEII